MRGGGGEVSIAHTPEHTQMFVRRLGAEEDKVRSGELKCFGGEQVEEVGGCMATQREGGADS